MDDDSGTRASMLRSVLISRGIWPDGSSADVLVRDGLVAPVDEAGPIPVLDAGGQLVLPGLVEAHCHLDKTLYGRPWVPHAAEDTLASRIATDRRRRSELGLPDPAAMRALLTRMSSCGTSLVRTHTDIDPEIGLVAVHRVAELADALAADVRVQQVAFPQHGLLSLPGTADLLGSALAEGCSVVGGLDPTADGDATAYLDLIFQLADRAGAQVDLHLHDHGAVGLAEIDLVVERTAALGMGGRVALSHVYCFGGLDEAESRKVAARLASVGVGVVIAAPYSFPVPPIRTLVEEGVVVAIGHDGIRDLWGPYGTGDLLDKARHVASRSGFRRDEDIELVLGAATTGGRQLVTGEQVSTAPGATADLVVVPASGPAEAVVTAPFPRTVVRGDLGAREC